MTTPLLLIIIGTVLVVSSLGPLFLALSLKYGTVSCVWLRVIMRRAGQLTCIVEEELLSDTWWSSVKM